MNFGFFPYTFLSIEIPSPAAEMSLSVSSSPVGGTSGGGGNDPDAARSDALSALRRLLLSKSKGDNAMAKEDVEEVFRWRIPFPIDASAGVVA